MTKPIFLVGLPALATTEELYFHQSKLNEKLKQYYVLVHQTNGEELTFKCFYEKDFDQVKFEELKQIVNDSIKNNHER